MADGRDKSKLFDAIKIRALEYIRERLSFELPVMQDFLDRIANNVRFKTDILNDLDEQTPDLVVYFENKLAE